MEPNRAQELLAQRCARAVAVPLAVCQEFEIEIDREVTPRIGFGFAGGITNLPGRGLR